MIVNINNTVINIVINNTTNVPYDLKYVYGCLHSILIKINNTFFI